jgi:predicted RNA binding protein YcfA (HicA-like mRNA interferase family)
MTTRPTISFRELIRRVEALGFKKIRQKGSHIRFSHPDGRKTTIPDHGTKDVPRGLLSKIVRYDLEIDFEIFLE